MKFHSDDANTSSPQRLSREQRIEIECNEQMERRRKDYREVMGNIAWAFRVEAKHLRRQYQDTFYNTAKAVGRIGR
jgi:hypothetical protein